MDSTPPSDFESLPSAREGHRSGPGPAAAGPALPFRKAWERERARRIHRICGCIERRVARGQTLREAVQWFAWYWKNRTHRHAPGRRVQLSAKTIVRHFYRWRENGRTPAAVALRYHCPRPKVSGESVLALGQLCMAPGTLSLSAAYRQLQNPPATLSAFHHGMPAKLHRALSALVAARRRVEVLERAASRAIANFPASIEPKAK